MMAATLEEALKKRYLDNEDDNANDLSIDDKSWIIFAPPRPAKLPNVIAINDCEINHLGDKQKVKELCSGIQELDLAQNRIKNIAEILQIIHFTSRLSSLNLSSNDLSHLCHEVNQLGELPAMKELILNNTNVSWDTISNFIRKTPVLEELYLCSNRFLTVELDLSCLPSLKLIHLSGNPIMDWCEVSKVGKCCSNLETLVMIDCEIYHLGSPDDIASDFPHLLILNLNNNKIENWEEIDKLHLFPVLSDVRLLGLPILEHYSALEKRQLLIGRLPSIHRMNGSIVTDNEREDADRAFIRYYMNKDEKPQRFYELESLHGKLDPLADVDLAPQMVAKVKLRFGDKCVEQKVRLKQTVSDFKVSLRPLTGLPACRMRIYYVDLAMGEAMGPEEMRFGAKFLYSYCVEDGDEFIIDEKIK